MDGIPKKWLTILEAAELTTLSVGTLYNMTSRREITHIKKGKRVIFDIDVLKAFMEKDIVFARETARPRLHVHQEQEAVEEVFRL